MIIDKAWLLIAHFLSHLFNIATIQDNTELPKSGCDIIYKKKMKKTQKMSLHIF